MAWDFRSADVAAGGQGAPLAPLFHAALAASLPNPLCVLNLGGVANLTFVDDGKLLACDAGPASGPIDDWVSARTGAAFDVDGRLALSGTVATDVLGRLMGDPFFAMPAPKSLDRLHFADRIAASGLASLSDADGAATLVAWIAAAVAAIPLPKLPGCWLVTGGGRRNAAIMAALRGRLGAVEPVEAVGWDGDALEAQCFGYLAVRVARGLPLSLPETTGVPHPMPGGRITRPA